MTHTTSPQAIELEKRYGANNYKPLDLVLERGEGVWVWDLEGKRYMDCLSAYSAMNHGHLHPRVIQALKDQADKLTLTSRAFRNSQLPLFYKEICEITGMDMVLPMNTGAEAVETALKAARKWGYKVKGIEENKAEIIVCSNNFHGRTISIISFSSEEQYKDGFGPFTDGFPLIEYGDLDALSSAIGPNTCAFLVEPIQGEAGVIIPPDGYLKGAEELCRKNNVLFMVDEIQTGFGRTGKLFASDHENVTPDVIIVGKALGGGVLPISAVLAHKEVLGVFNPGDHGSTFGGNPLGCAVAREALKVLIEDGLVERSQRLGATFLEQLQTLKNPNITEIRGRGLFIGIEMNHPVRYICEQLMDEGLLCKETHENVIRIAPPLTITDSDLEWAFERIKQVIEGAV